MICSHCGHDKPESDYPVLQGRRRGRVCKQCRNDRYRLWKSPDTGICRHCGQLIYGRTKNARYHIDADHPECYAAYRAHMLEVHRNCDKRIQEERKLHGRQDHRHRTGPPCHKCGKPMPEGNRYYCPECWDDLGKEMDIEFAVAIA